jgi:hypothetical protein
LEIPTVIFVRNNVTVEQGFIINRNIETIELFFGLDDGDVIRIVMLVQANSNFNN